MAKVRLTKNELKAQKEALERYERYLPTLELKKAQLILEIRKLRKEIAALKKEKEQARQQIRSWVDLFAEDIDISAWISLDKIETKTDNIAGIDIEVFDKVIFDEKDVDYFTTPLWVDQGIVEVKKQIVRQVKIMLLERQIKLLDDELRTTIQRINLFEKVKIPEARENIRIIQIYLGDQRTAEVVRGKIAKDKIQKKKERARA